MCYDFDIKYNNNLVSGGFATVHPDNKLTINAVEAAPLEEFSPEVRNSAHFPLRIVTHIPCNRLFVPTSRRLSVSLLETAPRKTSWKPALRPMFTRPSNTLWADDFCHTLYKHWIVIDLLVRLCARLPMHC